MTDNSSTAGSSEKEHLSPIQTKLLDTARTLYAKGIEPTHKNLAQVMSNHSTRDYVAALAAFKAERDISNKWVDCKPEEVDAYMRLLGDLVWAKAKEQFNRSKTETDLLHKAEMDAMHAAREESELTSMRQQSQLEELCSTVNDVTKSLDEAKLEITRLQRFVAEKDMVINELRADNAALERTVDILSKALEGTKVPPKDNGTDPAKNEENS